VGNPANTNCLIAASSAPGLPKENFSCLTRLDHNRAKSLLAKKLGTSVSQVHNVIVWGNHSNTQYPDANHAHVETHGSKVGARTTIGDEKWLQEEFVSTVQQRGAAVIAARQLSSAASAAKAIVDHMRDWVFGTPPGEWVSMGVWGDGSYGMPEGLIYSYPVTISGGRYSIVRDLPIDVFSRGKMETTEKELLEEKETALEFLRA